MFEVQNGKVSLLEFFAVFVFSMTLKSTEVPPGLLVKYGGTGAWIVPIISFIIILIPFLILQKLLKDNKNKGLMDIIINLTGKYMGFLIGNILMIVIFASITLSSRSYVKVLNALYYPRSPGYAIYLGLIGVSCYAALKGFNKVGRACLIALPYLSVVIILLAISIWKGIDYRLALPIGGTGFINEIKAGFQYSSLFGDAIVLSVFFPYIKNFTEYKIASNIGLLVAVIFLSFFTFAYLAIFGYAYLEILNFPFHELIRTARLGETINNIDAVYLGFWLIAVVFHLAIYLCALASIYSITYKVKNIKVSLIIISAVVIYIGLKLSGEVYILHYYKDIELKIGSYLLLSLPIFLMIVDKVKGGGSN